MLLHHPISIHASLAGGDTDSIVAIRAVISFQSTPPSREATLFGVYYAKDTTISIHASLAGGDVAADIQRVDLPDISIHASLAGGDYYVKAPVTGWTISIHASLAGGDKDCCMHDSCYTISIHASLAGGDRRSFA